MKAINLKVVVGVTTFALLAMVIAAIVSVVGPSSSLASSPTQAQAQATATSTTNQPKTDKQAELKQYYDLYQQKLADSLGVSKDKLTAAQKQAFSDTVDQAVKDGKLTQTQADKLKQMAANAPTGFAPGFGGMMGGHGGMMGGHGGMMGGGMMGGPGPDGGIMRDAMQQVTKAVADKLGLTTDQLTTDLRGGQSLLDLAKSKNVSEADLRATISNTLKPILDQAVKDGKLPQQMEDNILQQLQTADLSKGFGFFGGPRGGFGEHGRGGWGQGKPGNPNPSPNSTPTPGGNV